MSGEALFVAIYATGLLAAVGLLELYGRQSTSAWAARIFAGYRRAVPDAPEPARPDEWPHSEVRRFHHVLSVFVSVAALTLLAVEIVRNHSVLETAILTAAALPHVFTATRLGRRLWATAVHVPE